MNVTGWEDHIDLVRSINVISNKSDIKHGDGGKYYLVSDGLQ